MRILRHLAARLVPSLQAAPVADEVRAATLEAFDRYCPAPCAGDPWPAPPGVRRREAAAVAARVRLNHIVAAAE